ncbi:MAG TPA: 30S ribosomal protein S4e, partial [Thermoplasmata archaeon]|nr:30S ribosomal protein S4e [Thermoplasmata archaeon]
FMDVISIDKLHKHYRLLFDLKGKITLVEIPEKNAEWKLVRIENKRNVKGGQIQLNLHDGRNIIVNREIYKPGDVLKIQLPEQKIVDHFPAKEDFLAMVTNGKHAGKIAVIESIEIVRSSQPNKVHFKEGFSTIFPYTFVIGRKIPEIKISEVRS